MSSSGKWVLWIVLIAASVALVVFAPKGAEVSQIVEPAPRPSALPASAASAPGARVPSPNESSTVESTTGPSAAKDTAPPAVAPPDSRPPVAVESAPDAGNAARIELNFPSQAVIGTTIDVLASVAEGTAANRVEVVVLYDPSALQLMSMGSGEPGRAEATIQISDNGRELGFAAFQFLVIASESKATVVTTAATAFNAAGSAVRAIVPPPQQIALDRPPS